MEVIDRIDQVAFDCIRRCSHLETCLRDFLNGQAEARYLYCRVCFNYIYRRNSLLRRL